MSIMLIFDPAFLEVGHQRHLIPSLRALGVTDEVVVVAQNPSTREFRGDAKVTICDLSAAPPWLNRQKLEPGTGDMYLQLIDHPEWVFHRYRAMQMLNRLDATGTFRFLDREVFISSLIWRCLALIRNFHPRLLVFSVTPHQVREYVLYSIAACLGIPSLFFQPCSFAPVMLPRTGIKQREFPILEYGITEDAFRTINESLDDSVVRARSLSDPYYLRDQRERDSKNTVSIFWSRKVSRFLKELSSGKYTESHDFTGNRKMPTLVARGLQVLISRDLSNQLRVSSGRPSAAVGELTDNFSAYFMHYEPERTSNPEGGDWLTQIDLVLHLASIDNLGPLVVKEHYSQTSSTLRGFMGRSPWFYDLLQSLERIDYLDSTVSVDSVLKMASRVITLTGTVAIEAAFAGVPAYHLGFPWWDGLPGSQFAASGIEIARTESDFSPSHEEIESFLHVRVNSQMIPGITSESTDGRFAQRFGFSRDFWEVSSSAIARLIHEHLR